MTAGYAWPMANVERRTQFEPAVGSAAAARRFMRGELEQLAVPEPPIETAILLTSELISNAYLHARTEVDLRLVMAPECVRVEVHDGNSRHPVAAATPADATSGRGLLLLQALAQSWGVDGTADGKTIWFELPIAT